MGRNDVLKRLDVMVDGSLDMWGLANSIEDLDFTLSRPRFAEVMKLNCKDNRLITLLLRSNVWHVDCANNMLVELPVSQRYALFRQPDNIATSMVLNVFHHLLQQLDSKTALLSSCCSSVAWLWKHHVCVLPMSLA